VAKVDSKEIRMVSKVDKMVNRTDNKVAKVDSKEIRMVSKVDKMVVILVDKKAALAPAVVAANKKVRKVDSKVVNKATARVALKMEKMVKVLVKMDKTETVKDKEDMKMFTERAVRMMMVHSLTQVIVGL
jgi:hypothetical protein